MRVNLHLERVDFSKPFFFLQGDKPAYVIVEAVEHMIKGFRKLARLAASPDLDMP